jgi:hypothetical protein
MLQILFQPNTIHNTLIPRRGPYGRTIKIIPGVMMTHVQGMRQVSASKTFLAQKLRHDLELSRDETAAYLAENGQAGLTAPALIWLHGPRTDGLRAGRQGERDLGLLRRQVVLVADPTAATSRAPQQGALMLPTGSKFGDESVRAHGQIGRAVPLCCE